MFQTRNMCCMIWRLSKRSMLYQLIVKSWRLYLGSWSFPVEPQLGSSRTFGFVVTATMHSSSCLRLKQEKSSSEMEIGFIISGMVNAHVGITGEILDNDCSHLLSVLVSEIWRCHSGTDCVATEKLQHLWTVNEYSLQIHAKTSTFMSSTEYTRLVLMIPSGNIYQI